MTIAQTRAARQRNRQFNKAGPLGQPRFHVPSVEKQQRKEMQRREKERGMIGRKKK